MVRSFAEQVLDLLKKNKKTSIKVISEKMGGGCLVTNGVTRVIGNLEANGNIAKVTVVEGRKHYEFISYINVIKEN